MKTSIQTTRLVGYPLCSEHVADMCLLHSDPHVMATLSADGKTMADERTAESVARSALHWREWGYGLWAFYRLDSNAFIGRGGLLHYRLGGLNNCEVIGLAYAVRSQHWNEGYATEMASAAIRFAFDDLHATSIASWALPHNHASQRVLQKLGFTYEQNFIFAGLPHKLYRLEWRHTR